MRNLYKAFCSDSIFIDRIPWSGMIIGIWFVVVGWWFHGFGSFADEHWMQFVSTINISTRSTWMAFLSITPELTILMREHHVLVHLLSDHDRLIITIHSFYIADFFDFVDVLKSASFTFCKAIQFTCRVIHFTFFIQTVSFTVNDHHIFHAVFYDNRSGYCVRIVFNTAALSLITTLWTAEIRGCCVESALTSTRQ